MATSLILVFLLVAGIFFVFLFNTFVRRRFLVREALSGIDVQLKRRHDLIPSIVEAVKGYAGYEKGLMEKITAIRSQANVGLPVQEKNKTETDFSQALRGIFALAEAYPDLKASQNFLALQQTLSEIEDQVQIARRYYNGTVRDYNIAVESFPSNIIAALFGFKPQDFFEIEYATERKVPEVSFGGFKEAAQ